MKNARARVCVALVTALLTGCSFTFMRSPKVDARGAADPECDEDVDSPWLDVTMAGSFVLPAIIAAGLASDCSDSNDIFGDDDCSDVTLGAIMSVVAVVAYASSAGYGYSMRSKCRKANERARTGFMPVPRPTVRQPAPARPVAPAPAPELAPTPTPEVAPAPGTAPTPEAAPTPAPGAAPAPPPTNPFPAPVPG